MQTKLLALVILIAVLTGCLPPTWKEYASSAGGFSVMMPGTPTEKTQAVNTQVGAIDTHMAILEQRGWAYIVSYNDYPEAIIRAANTDKLLDGARDGAVSNVQGKLVSELIISLDKYPGRELKIEAANGKLTMNHRIYMVKNRMYQVGVVTPKEQAFDKDVTKFLDSFKLTGN